MLLTPTNCCHGDGGDGSPFSSYIICANVSAMCLTPDDFSHGDGTLYLDINLSPMCLTLDDCCHSDGSLFSSYVYIADIPCMDWRIELVTWQCKLLVRHSQYLAWNLASYVGIVSSRVLK